MHTDDTDFTLGDDNEESQKKGSNTATHYDLNKDSLNSTRTRHVNGREMK